MHGLQVEMTTSRGLLRVAGTAVGGTLGFAVMLRAGLASNPYLLMLMVVATAFVFGLAGRSQYLCALFLVCLGDTLTAHCPSAVLDCLI